MKVLFSVNGIGLGHATRSLAVANAFRKADILFISFGEGYNFLRKHYPTKKVEWFSMEGKFSIEVFDTFLKILASSDSHKKSKEKIKRIIEKFKPDVIISDSEIMALDIGYNLGIPTFSISNLYSVSNNYRIIPKELKTTFIKLQKNIVEEFNKYIMKRSEVVFYPSFDKIVKHYERTKIVDLIVRRKPKRIDYKKKIYVTVGGAKMEKPIINTLVRSLKKINDYEFIVSGCKRNGRMGNIILRTFIDPFDILEEVSGVITTAGHSSISEALIYKKPVLAVPIVNHVEQLSNAYAIKELGVGDVILMKDLRHDYSEEISKFIERIPEYISKVEKLSFIGFGAEEIHDYISRSI